MPPAARRGVTPLLNHPQRGCGRRGKTVRPRGCSGCRTGQGHEHVAPGCGPARAGQALTAQAHPERASTAWPRGGHVRCAPSRVQCRDAGRSRNCSTMRARSPHHSAGQGPTPCQRPSSSRMSSQIRFRTGFPRNRSSLGQAQGHDQSRLPDAVAHWASRWAEKPLPHLACTATKSSSVSEFLEHRRGGQCPASGVQDGKFESIRPGLANRYSAVSIIFRRDASCPSPPVRLPVRFKRLFSYRVANGTQSVGNKKT
jgi:hypothetical protein